MEPVIYQSLPFLTTCYYIEEMFSTPILRPPEIWTRECKTREWL